MNYCQEKISIYYCLAHKSSYLNMRIAVFKLVFRDYKRAFERFVVSDLWVCEVFLIELVF